MPRKKGTGFQPPDDPRGDSSSRRQRIASQPRLDDPGQGDQGDVSQLPTIQETDYEGDVAMGADDNDVGADVGGDVGADFMDVEGFRSPSEESSSDSDSEESDGMFLSDMAVIPPELPWTPTDVAQLESMLQSSARTQRPPSRLLRERQLEIPRMFVALRSMKRT